MAADAPWTKVFHDEALQGAAAANLSAEEFGVYWTVLLLIASRGAPIEDDRAWLARRCNISTRRLNQILARLTAIPNKLVVRNGMIGNHKMLGVIKERDKKSDQARRAAHSRWHGDDAELPLEAPAPAPPPARARTESAGSGSLSRLKPEDKSEIIDAKNDRKPQKTATVDDADACFPRASARVSETQSLPNPTHPKDLNGVDLIAAGQDGMGDKVIGGLLADADLRQLYEAVAEASGHSPADPTRADRAMRFIEGWRKDGLDFDLVVIPTIRAMVSESREPTRTLGRFDARVRHEHARLKATNGSGRRYRAPPEPVMLRPDEPEDVRPFRAALLEVLGPQCYVRLANKIRLDVVPERGVIRLNDPGPGYLLDEYRTEVRGCAKAAGFKEVW
jgi:hypothetical protein